jgi:hypothetical protein
VLRELERILQQVPDSGAQHVSVDIHRERRVHSGNREFALPALRFEGRGNIDVCDQVRNGNQLILYGHPGTDLP